MTKKRHTPEQIVTLLRQVEVTVSHGKSTLQACKKATITEQTYYGWRKEYGGLKLVQAKRLKERQKHIVQLARCEGQPDLSSAEARQTGAPQDSTGALEKLASVELGKGGALWRRLINGTLRA